MDSSLRLGAPLGFLPLCYRFFLEQLRWSSSHLTLHSPTSTAYVPAAFLRSRTYSLPSLLPPACITYTLLVSVTLLYLSCIPIMMMGTSQSSPLLHLVRLSVRAFTSFDSPSIHMGPPWRDTFVRFDFSFFDSPFLWAQVVIFFSSRPWIRQGLRRSCSLILVHTYTAYISYIYLYDDAWARTPFLDLYLYIVFFFVSTLLPRCLRICYLISNTRSNVS